MKVLKSSIEKIKTSLDIKGNLLTTKDEQVCPICSKKSYEIKSAVHCPKYKTTVCMEHCFKGCNFLEDTYSIVFCKYRFRNSNKNEHEKNTLHLH